MNALPKIPKMLYQPARTALFALLLALSMAFIATPAYAIIRYVDPTGAAAGDCSTPGTACNTIGHALDEAANSDEIRIAKGTYTEGQLIVSKQVTLIGGFDPTGPTLWNTSNYSVTPTILDGEGTNRPLAILSDNVIIEFMTIQNGNAESAISSPDLGGGILVLDAENVTLAGLRVIHNIASAADPTSTGGGIAIVGDTNVDIERSFIYSNTTPGLGGGIGVRVDGAADQAIVDVRSSVIAHNAAAEGGAFATSGNSQSVVSFFYATLGDNNKGAADEGIFMTGGHAATANHLNFSSSLLAGNTTAFRSNLAIAPIMLSTALMLDTNVTNDWAGTLPALNPAQKRPLRFANPDAANYHLLGGSAAIDIALSTNRVDLEGRQIVNKTNCTPFSACPLGRFDDYGAYEYVHTAAVVRYVANEGADSANNCLDPDFPCQTLESVNEIVLGGDEIRLAHGTYNGDDNSCANLAAICIREAITVTGGFTTTNWNTPTNNPALTIISGSDTRRGIMIDYDYPFASTLIRNLTVRDGKAFEKGGGIAINTQNIGPTQNVTLRNCHVAHNRADSNDGGGIFVNRPNNMRIESCTIHDNYAQDGRGGGVAMVDDTGAATYTLTSLVVYNNFADRPDENSANGGMGGGIFLQGIGTLRQSEIYSNTAAFSGGGVTTGSNLAHPTIDRVTIRDNRASLGGGFSIFLTAGANLQNSLLVRNAATSTVGLLTAQTIGEPMLGGNAIHSPYIGVPNEPLRVINVTIADNVGAVDDAIRVEGSADGNSSRRNFFTNVLISGSSVGIRSDGDGFAELTKVLIINNVATPTDGFSASRLTGTLLSGDLGFVGSGDYHLVPGADGVDDGDTVPGITQALDGVPRPVGPAFDIGAYETTLQKQNQTITFANIVNKALSESPVPINPTASSGLPVQVTSLTLAVCEVSATQITLLTEGTCSVRASQPGNATFNAAPPVTRTFQISTVAPPPPDDLLYLPALENE